MQNTPPIQTLPLAVPPARLLDEVEAGRLIRLIAGKAALVHMSAARDLLDKRARAAAYAGDAAPSIPTARGTPATLADSPMVWFAVLERARSIGDAELQNTATDELQRLGVRVTWEDDAA